MTDNNWTDSRNLTLGGVIGSMSWHPDVAGVLMIGSAVRGELGPASDYDLVIGLRKPIDSWFVGVTEIDGRMADLVFVTE
jgi:predicted nucleotidyltransferase